MAVGLGCGMVYTLWSIALPRSGGDYVWLSRAIHPVFGFTINWFLTFVFLVWFGANCLTLGPWFLGPLFQSFGMSALASAVSTVNGSVIIGTIFLVLCSLLLLARLKTYAKVFLVLFAATLIGSIVYVALFLSSSNAVFTAGFNHAVTGTTSYQGIMDTAKKSGWVPGWTMTATLGALFFPFQNYSWVGFPAYIGGEIKRMRSSAWVGIIGGLLVMGTWYVIMGDVIYRIVGYDFHSALTWLYNRTDFLSAPLSTISTELRSASNIKPGYLNNDQFGFRFQPHLSYATKLALSQ